MGANEMGGVVKKHHSLPGGSSGRVLAPARAGAEPAAGVLGEPVPAGQGGRTGSRIGHGLFKNKRELSRPRCWEREQGRAKRACLEIAALCRAADEVPIIALSFLPFFPFSSR